VSVAISMPRSAWLAPGAPGFRNIHHFENYERIAICFDSDSFHNGVLFSGGLRFHGRKSISGAITPHSILTRILTKALLFFGSAGLSMEHNLSSSRSSIVRKIDDLTNIARTLLSTAVKS
jgi:hypothetical protein